MTEELSTLSLKRILAFPFKGSEWQGRLLIGAALLLAGFVVPIVPTLFVYGYVMRVMRDAVEGGEPSLPDWEDWGGLAKDGLRAMAATFVYLLPATILMIGGMLAYFVMPFGLLGVGGLLEEGDAIVVGFPLALMLGMVIMFAAMALGMLLYVVGAAPLPIVIAHLAAEAELSAAFRVRDWWPILAADKLGYFADWVVVAGLTAIVYMGFTVIYFAAVLCWPLMFVLLPVMLYVMLVAAALFGQTYRRSRAALGG